MNKTIRKSSILATVATVAVQSAVAAGFRAAPVAEVKEGAWSFGFSGGTSYVGGEAREHVFAPQTTYGEIATLPPGDRADAFVTYGDKPGRRHQVSRLDWEIAASMIGFTGSARRDRLSLNLGVWYGGSGSDDLDMDDYDWYAGDYNGYTHHSWSEVELTDAWMFDANVSFDFWRDDAFTAYVFAGMREQRWKWTQDGLTKYWYPPEEGGRFSDKGHGIDYRQVVDMAYAGLGGAWKLSDTLTLNAYGSWAPRYAGRDHDNHISAEKYFRESFGWDDGNVYAAGLSLDWKVVERTCVFFAMDWQKATLHEGDVILLEMDSGEVEKNEDSAGFENEYVALSVGLKYTF